MKVAFVYMNNERNVGRGAGCVAASVVRAGHEQRFFDTFYTPVEDVADHVIQSGYDILMISTMSMIFPEALRLIKRIRERKSIPVLVGGIHPTIMGEKLLEEHEEIDYLAIGEGETMVVEFLEAFKAKDFANISNLVYRKGKEIIKNPVRPAEDLSTLPFFPWWYFPEESIVQEGQGFLYVDATRGCPYACTYCCNEIYLKLYGKQYIRFRPEEQVIEELSYLKTLYSPKLFYFGDEMILSNAEYAKSLFRRIKEETGVPYGCMARVEHINQEIVDMMKETGCKYLAMGLECGDEQFRRTHLKRFMTNEKIIEAFTLVKKAGIFVTSFNMIGYPFDNDDELTQKTKEINDLIKPNYVQVSIFYPLPGTQLYQYCMENNRVDLEKYSNTTDYFSESVLKNVSAADRKDKLNRHFNPKGFVFDTGTAPGKPAPTSKSEEAEQNAELIRRLKELNNLLETKEDQRDNAEKLYAKVIGEYQELLKEKANPPFSGRRFCGRVVRGVGRRIRKLLGTK